MVARMEIKLEGLERYKAALREAQKRGRDMAPLMDSIGQGLEASTRERFAETSTAPDGTPWPPSIAEQEGRRTLVQSGNLSDSITHEAASDHVQVGTNVLYAAVHQFGATITAKSSPNLTFQIGDQWVSTPSVEIPDRPFIGISAEDEQMILEEATDWLRGAFE